MLGDDETTPVDPPPVTLSQRLDRIEVLQRRQLRAHRLAIESLWRIETALQPRPSWLARLWRWLFGGRRAA